MRTHQFAAIVGKELKLFFSDRRALLMTFVTPIAIASFFGFLFSGEGSRENVKVQLRVVDHDQSALSRAVIAGLTGESLLAVTPSSLDAARTAVRTGKAAAAVVVPRGFGAAAPRAIFTASAKPELLLLQDPSRAMELGAVRGLLAQHVMQAVGRETFSGEGGRRMVSDGLANVDRATGLTPADRDALRGLLGSLEKWQDRQLAEPPSADRPGAGLSVPFTLKEEAVTGRSGVAYNSYAHSFAGMGVQFVLFAAIELGIALLLERKGGAWQRLRSAPLAKSTLLGGKAVGGALIACSSLAVTFAFGIVVFRIQVLGSWPGFLALIVATASMTTAFGLLLAALGRTAGATRGIAIMAVLLLVMLGGGWVPAFIFPRWMQTATLLVPTRWAIDGFDAATWRGVGLAGLAPAIGMLLAFTLAFLALAWWRFRWHDDRA